MERFLQAAALAMVAAVLAVVLQKQSKEISVLLVMGLAAPSFWRWPPGFWSPLWICIAQLRLLGDWTEIW